MPRGPQSRNRNFRRVQVRSTNNFCEDKDRYFLATTRGVDRRRNYTADEIDFLAALVVPFNAWYIFPVSFIADRRTLKLAPHRRTRSETEQFREAWFRRFQTDLEIGGGRCRREKHAHGE